MPAPAPRTELVVRGRAGLHPGLREHVLALTGFGERAAGPVRRLELPFSGTAVIVALDGDWAVGPEAGALERFTSFAGGLIDRPVLSEHGGRAWSMQLDLTPLGAVAVLGVPGRELAHRVVGLDDLLGPSAALLAERLASAPGWPERFALLEGFLLRRVAAARTPAPDVTRAWRRLTATRGALGVEALAAELRCSRRHLARRFGETVGVPPRTYGRLLRFEHAVDHLRAGSEDLGRIAADCGFYDQAHMVREVRAFAGTTPSALRARFGHAGLLV